jgi:hypothetical protein
MIPAGWIPRMKIRRREHTHKNQLSAVSTSVLAIFGCAFAVANTQPRHYARALD